MIFNSGCARNCLFCFVFVVFCHTIFIWKASGKTRKVKPDKKKKNVLLPYTDLELKTPSYKNQFLFLTKRKFPINLFLEQWLCILFTTNKSTRIFSSCLRQRKIQDCFYKKNNNIFLYIKLHIFQFFFLKRHTYRGGFQKYFIRSGKIPEFIAIAGPRKNGREVAKNNCSLNKKKIEKILRQTQKGNQERQLEFQK